MEIIVEPYRSMHVYMADGAVVVASGGGCQSVLIGRAFPLVPDHDSDSFQSAHPLLFPLLLSLDTHCDPVDSGGGGDGGFDGFCGKSML
jgi:hypothetical protein